MQYDERRRIISVQANLENIFSHKRYLVEISLRVKTDFTFDMIFCTAESICRQPNNEECQLACKAHGYDLDDKGKVSSRFTPNLKRPLIDQSDLQRILRPYCETIANDVEILTDRMGQIIQAQNPKLVDKRMAHQLHSKCTISVQKQLSSGIYSGSFNTYQNVQLFSVSADGHLENRTYKRSSPLMFCHF